MKIREKALEILAEELDKVGARDRTCINHTPEYYKGIFSQVERNIVDKIANLYSETIKEILNDDSPMSGNTIDALVELTDVNI
jgi:hypothetical protein